MSEMPDRRSGERMRPEQFEEPRPGQVVHEMTFRVCMRDVDHANIYYATYYEWMDRSTAEFFHAMGHPLAEIFDRGLGIPAVQSGCTYLAPVGLDDVLRVRTWVARMGRTSFTMAHEFIRLSDGKRVAQGFVTDVWVKRPQMEPTSPPEWFRRLANP